MHFFVLKASCISEQIIISVSIQAESAQYVNELLGKFEEPVLKQNIAAALISRRKLDIGDLVGKGQTCLHRLLVFTNPIN